MKKSYLYIIILCIATCVFSQFTSAKTKQTKNCLIEELRPKQIMDVVSKSSMVFIPVSPVFEWHSYHLPLATDAIISE